MDELHNWLALASVHGLDGLKYQRLREHISLAELVKLPASTLRNIGLTERQAYLLAHEAMPKAQSALRWLDAAQNHHVITYADVRYPSLLNKRNSLHYYHL